MYENIQNSLMQEQERRKMLQRKMMQPDNYNPNAQVSGRSVPYSPIQGLSKIAQAMIQRSQINDSNERTGALNKEMGGQRENALGRVMDTYQGSPEQPAESFNGEAPVGPARPGIEANPVKAAMMAASDPYLQESGLGKMMFSAQNAGKSANRGSYWTNIPLRNGKMAAFDARSNTMVFAGTDIPVPEAEAIAAKYDYETKRNMSAADKAGGQQGEGGFAPTPNGMQGGNITKADIAGDVTASVENAKADTGMLNQNSPEYLKQQKLFATDDKSLGIAKLRTDGVMQKIRDITSPSNRDAFNANFGGYNALVTQYQPGDKVQSLRKKIESIGNEMKVAGLEIIRSGGSIGQMTEKEWPIVQGMIDAISPLLGEKEALDAFKNVETYMQRIIDNAQSSYDKAWTGTPFVKAREINNADTGAIDLTSPPKGWDVEDYKYLSDDEKRQLHGGN